MSTWNPGGVILGEYTIEKELGRGGMGRVWLVKSQSTGRRFAVKQALIRDEKHRKAFLTELQTWIDLPEHPNIVPCRFFRTVGDEIVIFADYIEGGSLADWIAKGKLTGLEQILDVAIQFAWGLHAIHERGLIHQDVKPGNVLMTPEGVPMVTDFGLARARLRSPDGAFVSPALPPGPGQQSVLVSSGGMTPAYASPEQRNGKPLSRKTDIWSWGVSVLDMFMGGVSCPHGGHIAPDVLAAFLENGPEDGQRPVMSIQISSILESCFSANIDDRWPDLNTVAQRMIELYAEVIGAPYKRRIMANGRDDSPSLEHDRRLNTGAQWLDPSEWVDKARTEAGIELGALLCAPGLRHSTRRAHALADLSGYGDVRNRYEGAILSGKTELMPLLAGLCLNQALIHEYLTDVPGCLNAYTRAIEVLEVLALQDTDDQVLNQLAVAYAYKANTLKACGDMNRAQAFYEKAGMQFKSLIEQDGHEELRDRLATVYVNQAFVVQAQGDANGAIRLCDDAIKLLAPLVEEAGRFDLAAHLAAAYINKGNALQVAGLLRAAISMQDQAIAFYQRMVERSTDFHFANFLAKACMAKASSHKELGELHEAMEACRDAIRIRERLVNAEGRQELADELAESYMIVANVLLGMNDAAASVDFYEKAIAIRERLVELEGRREVASCLAVTYMNSACAAKANGDFRRMLDMDARAINTLDRLVCTDGRKDLRATLAFACTNGAINAHANGLATRSLELCGRAKAIYDQLVEGEGQTELSGDLGWMLMFYAARLSEGGDLPQGKTVARRAMVLLDQAIKETGSAELKQAADWAVNNLGHLLEQG